MKRTISLVALAACARQAPAPTTTALPVAPASAFPGALAHAPALPPRPSEPSLAESELAEIRRIAKVCASDPDASECENGRMLARTYSLMHCGREGVDPAYTFAWAAAVPLPNGKAYQDEFGTTWYVEPERAPKLERVDEQIWSESGWFSAEPTLRFVSVFPTEAEAKRLSQLDAEIRKKTHGEGVVRAAFHGDQFIGAFPVYGGLTPSVDGGMLYGFLSGPNARAHPLCKVPEARELPEDLAEFAGTWSRLR